MTHFFAVFQLRPIDGINILILLVLLWVLIRIVRNGSNDVEWADYISTRGVDGRQHGDIDKIGKWFGIVLSTMSVLMYADNEKVEPTGLAALLAVSLAYLGGVAAYSAKLRSQQGSVVTVAEPAEPVGPMKTTKTETPPIAEKP